MLEGKLPGQSVGRPCRDQAEIARGPRLDVAQRRLARTRNALDIIGKAHVLLEDITESADTEQPRSTS